MADMLTPVILPPIFRALARAGCNGARWVGRVTDGCECFLSVQPSVCRPAGGVRAPARLRWRLRPATSAGGPRLATWTAAGV